MHPVYIVLLHRIGQQGIILALHKSAACLLGDCICSGHSPLSGISTWSSPKSNWNQNQSQDRGFLEEKNFVFHPVNQKTLFSKTSYCSSARVITSSELAVGVCLLRRRRPATTLITSFCSCCTPFAGVPRSESSHSPWKWQTVLPAKFGTIWFKDFVPCELQSALCEKNYSSLTAFAGVLVHGATCDTLLFFFSTFAQGEICISHSCDIRNMPFEKTFSSWNSSRKKFKLTVHAKVSESYIHAEILWLPWCKVWLHMQSFKN